MSGPGGVAGDRLRSFVERIEHLEEEIKQLTEDKKDIYTEAKGDGFDYDIIFSKQAEDYLRRGKGDPFRDFAMLSGSSREPSCVSRAKSMCRFSQSLLARYRSIRWCSTAQLSLRGRRVTA